MIFDQSPFEFASGHIHLITWPVLIGFAWKISRFFTRQEIQVAEDRAKLQETHDATKQLSDTNTDLLKVWREENGTLKQMVTSMTQLQRDFHDHTLEDKFAQELVVRNQDTLIRGIEDIKRQIPIIGA